MESLLEYLTSFDHSVLFQGHEFNNAIRFLYTAIASAVHDEADLLIVKPYGFEWYKGASLLGTYLGSDSPTPELSYSIELAKIMKQDYVLGKFLKIVTDDLEQTIVKIAYQ